MTVSGRTIRDEMLDDLLREVGGEQAVYVDLGVADGALRYTDVAFAREDDLSAHWRGFLGRRLYRLPWSPTEAHPALRARFLTLDECISGHEADHWQVRQEVYDPVGVQDHLRALFYEGTRFIGHISVVRRTSITMRGRDTSRADAQAERIRRALLEADARERLETAASAMHAVLGPDGSVLASGCGGERWMTPERRARALALWRRQGQPGGESTTALDGSLLRMSGMQWSTSPCLLVRIEPVGVVHLSAVAHLTPRQAEVARFAAAGATVAEIARAMDISVHTARDHLKAVYQRLEVANRVELARRIDDELEGPS